MNFAKLLGETMKRFPHCTILTPGGVPLVYGEHVRMATLVVRVQVVLVVYMQKDIDRNKPSNDYQIYSLIQINCIYE